MLKRNMTKLHGDVSRDTKTLSKLCTIGRSCVITLVVVKVIVSSHRDSCVGLEAWLRSDESERFLENRGEPDEVR
jgi:hypothetical protein